MKNKAAPILIAHTRPFRLVLKGEEDEWSHTIKELNSRDYDAVKLHRLSTSFDVGLGLPLCLHVGFNGALILPSIERFKGVPAAVQFYNDFLGVLLLGGVYHESVSPYEVCRGYLHLTGYFRSLEYYNKGANARFQIALQEKMPSVMDVVELLDPPRITAYEMHQAWNRGKLVREAISPLSPAMLLRSVTGFITGARADALWNSWICIEQVIGHIWDSTVVLESHQDGQQIPGRKRFLEDGRTWTLSTKAELLFQRNQIDEETYQYIIAARKARNRLAHEGLTPKGSEAEAALLASFRLIGTVSVGDADSLSHLVQLVQDDQQFNSSQKQGSVVCDLNSTDTGLWLGPLPPIPGDSEWGDKEYEHVYPEKRVDDEFK